MFLPLKIFWMDFRFSRDGRFTTCALRWDRFKLHTSIAKVRVEGWKKISIKPCGMYGWFDCHLPGCGGFTEYFWAKNYPDFPESSTSIQSIKLRLQKQNCLIWPVIYKFSDLNTVITTEETCPTQYTVPEQKKNKKKNNKKTTTTTANKQTRIFEELQNLN